MNEPFDWKDLIDLYLDDSISPEQFNYLQNVLAHDLAARAWFVQYTQMDWDLTMHVRSQAMAERALAHLPQQRTPVKKTRWFRIGTIVVCLLLLGLLLGRQIAIWQYRDTDKEQVAWLVNAQNCQWQGGEPPAGIFVVGTELQLESGLAEIHFKSGANVILNGPAHLVFGTGNSATLHRGKLSAQVPPSAHGFTIFSPQGEVIDLGTEFGITVDDQGATAVYVFEGKIKTGKPGGYQEIHQHVGARLNDGTTTVDESLLLKDSLVRQIRIPSVKKPTTTRFDFRTSIADSLQDRTGNGIGLTHRLPGTGEKLPQKDPNLLLNPKTGLELTTTKSDINHQAGMPTGEYFGIPLKGLNFQPNDNFEILAEFPDIPALPRVGQFGLYAGTRSDCVIRGGLIRRSNGEYTQNLVNNFGGKDENSNFIGVSAPGDSTRMILRRIHGKYSMTVENLTTGNATTLSIKHPDFLDNTTDLHVGIFGANTQSDQPKLVTIRLVQVTVWAETESQLEGK
ncbi:MAG: FecR domain-containing protein [Zavarzinella sp.]